MDDKQIDQYVGKRMRRFRKMADMSQTKLGEEIGVTFQQVQKYERGSNRISASRLYRAAHVLNITVGDFFAGVADEGAA